MLKSLLGHTFRFDIHEANPAFHVGKCRGLCRGGDAPAPPQPQCTELPSRITLLGYFLDIPDLYIRKGTFTHCRARPKVPRIPLYAQRARHILYVACAIVSEIGTPLFIFEDCLKKQHGH